MPTLSVLFDNTCWAAGATFPTTSYTASFRSYHGGTVGTVALRLVPSPVGGGR